MNILIYDDNIIEYFSGVTANIEKGVAFEKVERSVGGINSTLKPSLINFCATVFDLKKTETIKLDETLMRRIAKYNKEQELETIENKIQNKKKELEELENKLQDREKRWKKVQDFISKIYEIPTVDGLDFEDCEDCWEEY